MTGTSRYGEPIGPTPAWDDDERPTTPGSAAMPHHPMPRRIAYGLVASLCGITAGLGNALVSANLPQIQGHLGLTPVEGQWLPAAYLMTNVSANLLLFKFRQQYGLRRFAQIGMPIYALVTMMHLFVESFAMAVFVRAVSGFATSVLSTFATLYMTQAFGKQLSSLVSLRLAQDQARVGYSSQFELTQAQSEYESVVGQVPELERGIRNAENALTLLTGDTPAATVSRGRLQDIKTPDVPSVLPSALLTRRPDLVAATLRLSAADSSLAAQRAAFLPSVSLSGSVGQLFVNGLNYDPVTVWSIGGSILAPIFEGGRLRAGVDVATAQRDEAALAYRGAALTAFHDVENALTDVRRYGEQIVIVRRRRDILLRSLALATDRYRGGYASYLDQLDAQRNLYSTELEAIGIRLSQLQAIVQLHAAFGGGWDEGHAS